LASLLVLKPMISDLDLAVGVYLISLPREVVIQALQLYFTPNEQSPFRDYKKYFNGINLQVASQILLDQDC